MTQLEINHAPIKMSEDELDYLAAPFRSGLSHLSPIGKRLMDHILYLQTTAFEELEQTILKLEDRIEVLEGLLYNNDIDYE